MKTVLTVVIRTQTGKVYHLVLVFAAVLIMMVLLRFLTMSITVMIAVTVAMVFMDVVA